MKGGSACEERMSGYVVEITVFRNINRLENVAQLDVVKVSAQKYFTSPLLLNVESLLEREIDDC